MQIPRVNSLYNSRVSSVMGRLPVNFQPASASFNSQYAAALDDSQAPGTLQELTLTNPVLNPASAPIPDAADTALPFDTQGMMAFGATSGIISNALPMYIPASSIKPVSSTQSPSALAEQVVDYAKQFVGTPYVAGGEDLKKGVDCSGFVQSIYAHFGVKLPRSSYRQSMVGEEVNVKDLQPGDLLFFKTADYAPVTHVAMYVGDGKIIHASSVKTGVIISKLKIKDDFRVARRLL